MSHDLEFRGVLVALCAVLFSIIAYYRVRSFMKGDCFLPRLSAR